MPEEDWIKKKAGITGWLVIGYEKANVTNWLVIG